MHFAILGTDADILSLAAHARELGHDFGWCGDVRSEDAAAVGPFVADCDRSEQWELLLDRATVDGVLVGHGTAPPELRAEQLKRLAAVGMPLLVVHPIFESVLPYYEIDMTRRETGAIVQHYNPLVPNTVAAQLAAWVSGGHPSLEAIHQLTCDRRVANADRVNVLHAMARDVELLTAVAGNIRRVSAIGPPTRDSSFASLQVQMMSTKVSAIRWSATSRLPDNAVMELALLGEKGTVLLREISGGGSPAISWELEFIASGERHTETIASVDAARAAIERFTTAISATDSAARAASSTWDSATRTMEVVDVVELSLQKGRTIEVLQQQLTEKLAFRGTMAALGCGLLFIAFFAAVAVAVLGGAEGIVGEKIIPAWPLLMLGVLAFFLLLQAVPLLVAKKPHDKRPLADPDPPR